MRAIEPNTTGTVRLRGFEVGYETWGDPDRPAILFLPAWQIVHSRIWKFQVPFLARHYRVITMDAAGNGLGERTCDPRAYEYERIAGQAIDLLSYLGVDRASLVGFSRGCIFGILASARHPERVASLVLIGGKVSAGWEQDAPHGAWDLTRPEFHTRRETYHGWQKYNAHFWREHYAEWMEFFFNEIFPEPHSTKAVDDCTAWGWQTDPEILIATVPNGDLLPRISASDAVERIECPVMMIHGQEDRCSPIEKTHDLARARPDWIEVTIEGAGHAPMARDPVKVNLLLRDFYQNHGWRPGERTEKRSAGAYARG